MRIDLPNLAIATFIAIFALAPAVRIAHADTVFLCSTGPNVIIANVTAEKIAKLRQTNACVRDYFDQIDKAKAETARRVAEGGRPVEVATTRKTAYSRAGSRKPNR